MNNKHSRLGISSTVLWCVIAIFCLYLWSLTQDQSYISSLGNTSEEIKRRLLGFVTVIFLSAIIGSLISLILGVVGIRSKDKNTLYAKIGSVLSITSIAGIVITLVIVRG